MILSPHELELLTGKTERGQKRFDSQAKELMALGIPFLRRSDKTLIVYRVHAEPDGQAEKIQEPVPAVLP